jgi:hypothetical protein
VELMMIVRKRTEATTKNNTLVTNIHYTIYSVFFFVFLLASQKKNCHGRKKLYTHIVQMTMMETWWLSYENSNFICSSVGRVGRLSKKIALIPKSSTSLNGKK